jgi:hypothetical protein
MRKLHDIDYKTRTIAWELLCYFCPPPPEIIALVNDPRVVMGLQLGSVRNAAMEVAMALHGIQATKHPAAMSKHDLELWCNTPLSKFLTPAAWKMAKHPEGILVAKAYQLRLSQCKVTAASLARELKVSVRTLYRRFGRDALQRARLIASDYDPAKIQRGRWLAA